jgi:hypothetical protein
VPFIAMPDSSLPADSQPGLPVEARPEVILDFDCQEGALYISLRNIGARPAHDVRTTLSPAIRGLEGRLDLAELPLFRGVPFFAPGKEIRFLLDSSALYFARGEPTRVTATLEYSDDQGRRFETVIQHDLEIYRSPAYRVR